MIIVKKWTNVVFKTFNFPIVWLGGGLALVPNVLLVFVQVAKILSILSISNE